jgi:hypothetical protein
VELTNLTPLAEVVALELWALTAFIAVAPLVMAVPELHRVFPEQELPMAAVEQGAQRDRQYHQIVSVVLVEEVAPPQRMVLLPVLALQTQAAGVAEVGVVPVATAALALSSSLTQTFTLHQ